MLKFPHYPRLYCRGTVMLPNNALHLQTAPVIILAFARTAPYAIFKLA